MSKWGDPADYECRVLVDPENNGWKTVATPEEAETYPVNEIRYKYAVSAEELLAYIRANAGTIGEEVKRNNAVYQRLKNRGR